MANEIVKQEAMGLDLPPVSEDIVVFARDPEEMARAQQGLITWVEGKLKVLRAELAEAEENLETSKRMKTRTDGWKRVVRLARNRVLYYDKVKAALEEGYCIIPDFPVELIAVRTSKDSPPARHYSGGAYRVPDAQYEQLPEGEGRYVSGTVETEEFEVDGKTVSRALDFMEVDFPFKVVKPQILRGMETALKRRLFDEIGVLPATHQGGDPVLVGRIRRREGSYREATLTFLIAWWIDTRSL